MNHRFVLALVLALVCTSSVAVAGGGTRISLDAGGLMPVGDMADVQKLSPYVGARWEYQEVNALGQISTRTWFLRFGYGFMLKEDIPNLPDDANDGYFLDACIGLRAYASSRFSPFFMSLSGGYAQYAPPGDSDTGYGGTLNGGLGIRLPALGFIFEAEARGHLTILDGVDNVQFFTGIVSLGIPL
jgi:hypothetical protein